MIPATIYALKGAPEDGALWVILYDDGAVTTAKDVQIQGPSALVYDAALEKHVLKTAASLVLDGLLARRVGAAVLQETRECACGFIWPPGIDSLVRSCPGCV